jgi:hypothetical protein
MDTTEILVKFPLQITFKDMQAPPDGEHWIRSAAAKLEFFYERILGCRVAVEHPLSHGEGSPYRVHVNLTVPGAELVISHEPARTSRARQLGEAEIRKHLETQNLHKYLRQAIDDAFKAAGRRLQDYAHIVNRVPWPRSSSFSRTRVMASLRQRKGAKSIFIKIACSTRPLTISGLEQPSILPKSKETRALKPVVCELQASEACRMNRSRLEFEATEVTVMRRTRLGRDYGSPRRQSGNS